MSGLETPTASTPRAATTFAELTTIRVGGPIARLERPATREEPVAAVVAAESDDARWLALGGGSNVVAPDDDYDGIVIRTSGVTGIESVAAADGLVHFRVAAGERWDDVVALAVERGLAGIEALSGIPGSVGAAPVQNVGAYGQELAGALSAVDCFDTGLGQPVRIAAEELGLGYRTSALKRGERSGVVLAV